MPALHEKLTQARTDLLSKLQQASNTEALEAVRLEYLSRQGILAQLTDEFKKGTLEEKRTLGPVLNALKKDADEAYTAKLQAFEEAKRNQASELLKNFDVTSYRPEPLQGHLHPYTHAIEQVEDIFISMGFAVADGPEVETDFYNFEALNIPDDHPARDMHDTFWLTLPNLLMRTHTSSVQIRAAQKCTEFPIAIVAPGKAYRHEATDASHDFMFLQCEGLFIDKNVSLANLFAVTETFLKKLFGKDELSIRMRPGFFPFVEPGVEIDMTCPFCTEGCSVCKHTRWIEICGAGLVHPKVLEAMEINPAEYSGFAFGFGLTRLVMLKYGISDIRLLHDAKMSFLSQF